MENDNLFDAAKKAAFQLKNATTAQKNSALAEIAKALRAAAPQIIEANRLDIAAAKAAGVSEAMQDRLFFEERRLFSSCDDIQKIIELADPVGEVLDSRVTQAGFTLTKVRVPFGVIGVIYESRPNVTIDVAVLCLKTGNACLLKGGKDAVHTNEVTVRVIREAIQKFIPADSVILMPSERKSAEELIKARGKVDLIVPRGSKNLINYVVENSKVPVIETGAGVCHLFVEKNADFDMAIKLLINEKTQRPSVCNAVETLLLDKPIAKAFIGLAVKALQPYKVIFRADDKTRELLSAYTCDEKLQPLTEGGYHTEYDALELSVRVVDGTDEAVAHINEYGTGHSDCIATQDSAAAELFINGVDSACTYHNVSTRFSDGGCFGFGAELGISTQKLHARGPMGLTEMTSYRYILCGKGETR